MRILLDTHVFIWAVLDDERLTLQARSLIEQAETVYVSVASLWEIAIKSTLGKIDADVEVMAYAIAACGFSTLTIMPKHIIQLSKAPLNPDHKDPFDRILIAQSMSEALVLLTADSKVGAYGELVRMV
jgi:PIN domain nuclease of toxin-antitoxin system